MIFFAAKEVECANCHQTKTVGTNQLGLCRECYRFVFAIDARYTPKAGAFDFKKAFEKTAPQGTTVGS